MERADPTLDMSNSNSTTFETSLALVLDEINAIQALHQSARTKRIRLAIDVCLVAHGVRTGYLVDAVFPPDPKHTLTTLLKALRGKSVVFKHVVGWHHTPTMQSFLVHVSLLQTKLAAVLGGTGECVFVTLDKHLSVSREPRGRLRGALRGVGVLMSESPDALALSLPDTFTGEIFVPLAGVMIDYPVAYVPAFAAQTSFLEGEALDIYTISFHGSTPSDSTLRLGKEHVLLKFSCPHALISNDAELSPDRLIEKLQARFAARLGRVGMQILVTHRTETLDRVAL